MRDLLDQVNQTSSGQYPFAVILGCIDSRVMGSKQTWCWATPATAPFRGHSAG